MVWVRGMAWDDPAWQAALRRALGEGRGRVAVVRVRTRSLIPVDARRVSAVMAAALGLDPEHVLVEEHYSPEAEEGVEVVMVS
jgi:hypothetical protein